MRVADGEGGADKHYCMGRVGAYSTTSSGVRELKTRVSWKASPSPPIVLLAASRLRLRKFLHHAQAKPLAA